MFWKTSKSEKGGHSISALGGAIIFNRMVRVELNEKLSFEKRLERSDRVTHILQEFQGSVS